MGEFLTAVASRTFDAVYGDWFERAVESWSLERPADGDSRPAGVATTYRLGDTETVEYPRPTCLGALPTGVATAPEVVETPAPTVWECPDAQLVGPDGLTFISTGEVLLENSLGFSKRVALSSIRSVVSGVAPYRRPRSPRSVDTAVSLTGPWADNYYHWHVDYLARLAALARYTEETGHRPPVLLPPMASEWVCEAAELAGYDEEYWIEWDGTRLDVERLIVPFLPRETRATASELNYLVHTTAPSAVRWLRDEMVSHSAGAESHAPSSGRLFVSRAGTSARQVRNRSALEPVLDRYGFEVIRPEQYAVAEQVQTFADVDVVLGPHGAGLTNLLFADDALCVELFGRRQHPAFHALATQVGLDYACLTCEPVGDDLRVDPDRLRATLDAAGVDPW